MWCCGPSQIFGLFAVPCGYYQYVMSNDDKEKERIWNNLEFNALSMIPLMGVMFAMDNDNMKKNKKKQEENK